MVDCASGGGTYSSNGRTSAPRELKGLVFEEMKRQIGAALLDELDFESRCAMRGLLFLRCVKRERERVKVNLCLLRAA